MNKAIIYGIGEDDQDVLEYFGIENIICTIESATSKTRFSFDIPNYLADEFFDRYKNGERFHFKGQKYEFIIVGNTIWDIQSAASKFERIGLHYYSVYDDIKCRYPSGADFLCRDRTKVLFERQSLLYLSNLQFQYMLRHTVPQHMLPATEKLREDQLKRIKRTMLFFDVMKDICRPIAVSGTLLGAVRHKGFIPWDDDLDFAITESEYHNLYKKLDDRGQLFKKTSDGIWKNRDGNEFCDSGEDFVCAEVDSYLAVIYGNKIPENMEECFCTDLFPLFGWSDDMDSDKFSKIVKTYIEMAEERGEEAFNEARHYMEAYCVPVEKAQWISFGLDYLSKFEIMYKKRGRESSTWIWDKDMVFPLINCEFEGFSINAPHDYIAFLEKAYPGRSIWDYPLRVGIYTHYKERIYTDIY